MPEPFAGALYRGITHRSPVGERSVPRMVAEVQDVFGPHAPEGMSASTWRRLRRDPGRNIKPATLDALRAAQRRVRLGVIREQRLRQPRPGIVVQADVVISNDDRGIVRTFRVGELPDPPNGYGPPISGMLNDVLDAWLLGDDPAAEQRFMDPIQASLGTPAVYFREIEEIRLG